MNNFYLPVLSLGAFLLGSCPFSLWIGKRFLDKDIRRYGDGNPGSANVFRAGGNKWGILALLADIGKGIPFILLASLLFRFSGMALAIIGLSAILGSAFSPILKFKGAKSVAITYGTMLALPDREMLFVFAALMFLCFLFIEIDEWTVILAPIFSLIYFAVTGANSWEFFYLLGVLIILLIKYFKELQTVPRFGIRVIAWVQSKRRGN